MSAEHGAQEHLRAIRQLMERATVYRAISAPTALVGGLLSVTLAAGMLHWRPGDYQQPGGGRRFLFLWTSVLILTGLANTYFIFRAARRRDEPLVSAGMKHALRALAPSFLTGGLTSVYWTYQLDSSMLATHLWLVFYGLGLLATMSFAPRSIIVLGWAFLVTGLGLLGLSLATWSPAFDMASLIMGVTFGGYHLCYAGIVWLQDRGQALNALEDRPLVTDAYPPLP